MRIAILGPIWKSIPPKAYGGSELIVNLLVEDLVRRGHDVTLFASGDSETSAKLSSIFPKNIYEILGKFDWKDISYNLIHAQKCFQRANEFQIIHNHLGPEALVFAPFTKTPVVSTLHSSLPPDWPVIAKAMRNEKYISISNAQRKNAPYLNWIGTVYHGIEIEKFPFNPKPKDYLFFIGTLSPQKGLDVAVRVAKKAKLPLIVAGDRRPEFEEFLEREVLPYIDNEQIKLIGEVNFAQKVEFYKNALALIFPIRWNEAFGLVMIEAMACGTPVIAFDNGAVPEIVENGVTGWIVKSGDEEGLVGAIKKIKELNREKIRKVAEEKFNAKRMVDNYEKIYKEIVKKL
jgi:glycosyltransferase involved in cell wall biosynthesis